MTDKNHKEQPAKKGSTPPYDENLLERSRTQWQFGDWQSLAELQRETLQHHPDRAKLALLAAAGHLQSGSMDQARQYVRLARDWGCDKKLVSRILIAGVHNSLGRAAAMAGKQPKALEHYEKSVGIGTSGSDVRLISKARASHQYEELGLLPGSKGRLQQIKALSSITCRSELPDDEQAKSIQNVNQEAYAFYKRLDRKSQEGLDRSPFLLLDSKSLPRAGLHYLKNTLAKLLGEHFSFCEWYNEPGCCKKTPCSLSGYAKYAQDTGKLRLRLTKSHDFSLTDPMFAPGIHLRHLILVRDPLFILTSWFALDQLQRHRDVLQQHGIKIEKLFLYHEKELLESSYRLLNSHFKEPSMDELTEWLSQKSNYIAGFVNKWVKPATEQQNPYTYLLAYEDINEFVMKVVNEYYEYLSESAKTTVNKFQEQAGTRFRKRLEPFTAPAETVGDYLAENSILFRKAAAQVIAADGSNYLKSISSSSDSCYAS